MVFMVISWITIGLHSDWTHIMMKKWRCLHWNFFCLSYQFPFRQYRTHGALKETKPTSDFSSMHSYDRGNLIVYLFVSRKYKCFCQKSFMCKQCKIVLNTKFIK